MTKAGVNTTIYDPTNRCESLKCAVSYGKTLSCVKEPMCASVDPDLCVDLLMQIVRQFWKQHVIARHRRKKRPIVLS